MSKGDLIILFVFCPMIISAVVCWIWEQAKENKKQSRKLMKARAKKNAR